MDWVSTLLHILALSAACSLPASIDQLLTVYSAVPLDNSTNATTKRTLGYAFGKAEPLAVQAVSEVSVITSNFYLLYYPFLFLFCSCLACSVGILENTD